MTETKKQLKHLCLGTALWGWIGADVDCYGVLDEFYQNGYRYLDTATIYPIDKNEASCGKSLDIIADWTKANGVSDLKAIVKLGGVNNLGSSENDFSKEFLKSENEKIYNLLGKNYYCSMIHWDNERSQELVEQNCENLKQENRASHLGLSGIKDWDKYLDKFSEELYLEVKNNILFDGVGTIPLRDREDKVFVYGTSVSGLKLDKNDYQSGSYVGLARDNDFHDQQIGKINSESIRDYFEKSRVVNSFYHLGIMLNESHNNVDGIIVGPRTRDQLNDILSFRDQLTNYIDNEIKLFNESYLEFLRS